MKRICLIVVLFAALALVGSCRRENRDYRQDMRNFVMALRVHAERTMPDFLLIPQNGEELLTLGDGWDTPPAVEYIAAIDGQGREDLLYGYARDNQPTAPQDAAYMQAHLLIAEDYGAQALVTDYCRTPSYMAYSYEENARWGFISFAAPERGLDVIPEYPSSPYNRNDSDITALEDAANFLYLLDPGRFPSREHYLDALDATWYDLFVIDAFYEENMLTADEVARLQTKPNGARRLVVAYMSIGEAEAYRYYWRDEWRPGNPDWLERENPDWAGNYKVRYWAPEWQSIIYGGADAYLDRIIAAGFDGAYLDLIDAYEYFE
ncbi:MAG TPA: hypothetical protein ENN29_03660 [Candidatus Hydrogenedentes bacterium]|nr:hypothetical protein [Candidatus Hydrogenedentota bacterium]